LNEQVQHLQVNYPYIAVVEMDTTIDLFLVAERVVVCQAKTVLQATQLLLAEFYVFNIAYPKYLGGLFHFYEDYLLGIKSQQTLPTCVIHLCSALV